METIDLIEKLIRLATNNPNEEEARSAALKAVTLIINSNITLGDNSKRISHGPEAPKYKPVDEETEDLINEILKGTAKQRGEPGLKVKPEETEIDDEFMIKRIKLAWNRIRQERRNVEAIRNEMHLPLVNWADRQQQ